MTEERTDQPLSPTKEAEKKRVGLEVYLFIWFYIAFIFKWIRAMFASFFGGNPQEELSEKVGVEQSSKLGLFATKNITLADYIEIQVRV